MPASNQDSTILVVGSDGLIGGALLRELEREGLPAIGTTRKPEAVNATRRFLDLSENTAEWQPDLHISVAVICAGVTRIEACQLDPVSTARINVTGVIGLAERLAAQGAFLVYLSTNQVFDGSTPNRMASDPTSALTEYGKQKAAVEKHLASHEASIVRLTKVIEPGMPLLQSWLEALRKGATIAVFKDMVMAPISLGFTTTVLRKVIEKRVVGIVQVSGEKDVTYEQVGYHLAERAGARRELVRPVSAKDVGFPSNAVPRFTTLDTTRLRTELGLEPPDVWTTIDSAIQRTLKREL